MEKEHMSYKKEENKQVDSEIQIYQLLAKIKNNDKLDVFQKLSNNIINVVVKRYSPNDSHDDIINGIIDTFYHFCTKDNSFKDLVNSLTEDECNLYITMLYGSLC